MLIFCEFTNYNLFIEEKLKGLFTYLLVHYNIDNEIFLLDFKF